MKRAILSLALSAAALLAPSAKADDFAISFDGGSLGYSGSGIFVGSLVSPGVWDITGVLSGSVADPGFGSSSITGISAYGGSDNLLYYPGGSPYFDENGLAFTLANGVSINLFDYVIDGTTFEAALQSNPNGDITEFVTDTVAPTPEPGSMLLLLTATMLGGYVIYRRRMPLTFPDSI